MAEEEYTLTADEMYSEAGAIYARGHVRIRHKDFVITGEEGEIDEEGVWALISGNVVIESQGQRTTGSRLRINLETEWWQLLDGKAKLEPEYLEDQVTEPVYVSGASLVSEPRRDLVVVRDATVTTCDHAEHIGEEVHYEMTADECRIVLNREVVLDHPTVWALGRRIFRYPGKLRLKMDEDRSRFIIEFGNNEVEGFYVKIGYPYEAGRSASGLARLHLTTKRGPGFGIEHWFDNGQSVGEIDLFAEPTQGAWSTRLRHRFQYSRNLSTQFTSSLQSNSGYGYGTTSSVSSDLTIFSDTGDTHTTLGFQHSRTSGTSYSSTRFTNNLTHQQRGPADIDWTLRSVYRVSDYSSASAADEELEVDLNMRRVQAAYDWELGYRQRFDLDGTRYTGDDLYYSLDELPSLILRTDTERMGFHWGLPIQTRLELGQFNQQPEDTHIQRASFLAEVYGDTIRLTKKHEVRSGAAFRQSFYSDGSAQYDLRASADFESHWGGPWYTRLLWDWEQPAGFSPLRQDYAVKRHDFEFNLSHYVANRSRVELNTGYDLQQSIWRDLVLRAEFTPNNHNRFEVQTSYDLEYEEFRPLEARWQFVKQRRLDMELSTSYDIEDAELSQIVIDSDWVLSPKWRFETLAGYNGTQGDFEFFETRITRDLHCWLASLSYSLSQREIRLNIGLKALTRGDWEYGLGSQGQRLTTRSGQYF
ncbi:MAG: hypothetical protein ACUVX8_16725 [Candidatus Zipacnadales bacterium]